jgi:hypothetical protein
MPYDAATVKGGNLTNSHAAGGPGERSLGAQDVESTLAGRAGQERITPPASPTLATLFSHEIGTEIPADFVAFVHRKRKLAGWALIVIGFSVWIGWSIVAPTNWHDVVQSHTRLGYLVGDFFLVAPVCVVAGLGLLKGHSWGPPALLAAVGAAAFDLTHTFIYMAQIGVPSIGGKAPPSWVYVLLIVLTLSVLQWIAWHEIRANMAPHSGIRSSWWWLVFFAVSIGALIVVLVV